MIMKFTWQRNASTRRATARTISFVYELVTTAVV